MPNDKTTSLIVAGVLGTGAVSWWLLSRINAGKHLTVVSRVIPSFRRSDTGWQVRDRDVLTVV